MVAHHLGGTFRVSSRNELHEGKMLASLAIERLLVPAPLQGKSWHALQPRPSIPRPVVDRGVIHEF